jgi:hypothetical protein
LGVRKVKGVGEIHSTGHPVKRCRNRRCVLQLHSWQASEINKRLSDFAMCEPEDAA